MDNVGVLLFLVGAVGTWYFIKKKKDTQKRNISIGILVIGISLVGIFSDTSEVEQSTVESAVESTISSSELQAIEESREAERLAQEEEEKRQEEIRQKEKQEKEEQEEKERAERANIMNLTGEATNEQKAVLNDLAKQQFDEMFPYKGSKIKTVLGVSKDWRAINNEWYYRADAVIVNEFGAEMETQVIIKIVPETESSGYVTIEVQ